MTVKKFLGAFFAAVLLAAPAVAQVTKPPITNAAGPTTSAQLDSIITDNTGAGGVLMFNLAPNVQTSITVPLVTAPASTVLVLNAVTGQAGSLAINNVGIFGWNVNEFYANAGGKNLGVSGTPFADYYGGLAHGTGLPLSTGITGWGTGVLAALQLNVGSAGAPVLFNGDAGTPSALVGTNISGTAASLTAGHVTANANLTGPITSVGNATSIASQTGTGTKFVVDTNPVLIGPTLGVALATSLNGNTFTTGTYTLTGAAGKTLTFSKSLTLDGTDSTTMTFPATSATIARTDAGQTFTGTQAFGAITYTTLNGNTWASGTGTLSIAAGKTFTASKTITLDGTDSTTMTFPTTSATIARTDAGQTFTGVQTMTSPAITTPAFTGAFSGTYSLGGTPTINVAAAVGGTWSAAATWTLPAHTLGGTVSGGGNNINNVIIGASTPLAGTFTTLVATTLNGNTFTTGTYTLTGTAGKTLTFSKSLTLDGTDSTTMTFPTTSATIARTDSGQTFTGVQTMTSPAITTPAFTGAFSGTYSLGGTPTINVAAAVGGTWTAAATWTLPAFTLGGTVSGGGRNINNVIIGASTPLAGTFTTLVATTLNGNTFTTGTYTLTGTAGKTLTFSKSLTLDGTDSTTMTFPATSATIARTDAGQTFTGVQTMTSPAITTPAFTGAFSGTYSLGGTPTINVAAAVGGTWSAAATWTLPAFTLGGTVSGGGNQINNVIIGSSTPLAGSFTTLSASGQITSTLATGSAPFVVASTTNVANLNASSLSGATFASPGAIGSGTPSTAVFSTLTASTFRVLGSSTGYTTITSKNASATNYILNIPTTATSSTYGQSLRPILNVKDYGAVGNGVTSDVAAFAAWWTDVCTNHYGDGYIPAGNYVLDGSSTIMWNFNACRTTQYTTTADGYMGITIFGDSMGRTILQLSTSANPMLFIGSTGGTSAAPYEANYATFRDFTINSSTANSRIMVQLGCNGTTTPDKVSGCGNGLSDAVNQPRFTNVIFTNGGANNAAAAALVVNNVTDPVFTNVAIGAGGGTVAGDALRIQAMVRATFVSSSIGNAKNAIRYALCGTCSGIPYGSVFNAIDIEGVTYAVKKEFGTGAETFVGGVFAADPANGGYVFSSASGSVGQLRITNPTFAYAVNTASFTGSGSGTTLTASSTSGTIYVGASVNGPGIPDGTYIASLGTGTGGNGTYITSVATTASGTVTSSHAIDPQNSSQIIVDGYYANGANIAANNSRLLTPGYFGKLSMNYSGASQPGIGINDTDTGGTHTALGIYKQDAAIATLNVSTTQLGWSLTTAAYQMANTNGSITLGSDGVTTLIGGTVVTNSFTATGLVTNADLTNSTITLGSTAMSLGSTYTTIAGAITWSGAATFSKAAGPQITMSGGTSNWIDTGSAGVGAPTFTTQSAGTKFILYNNLSGASAGVAMGVEAGYYWFGVDATGTGFKWYAGTTQRMILSGTNGYLGIGNITPATILHVNATAKAAGADFGPGSTGNLVELYGNSSAGGTVHIGTNYYTSDGALALGTFTTPDAVTIATNGGVTFSGTLAASASTNFTINAPTGQVVAMQVNGTEYAQVNTAGLELTGGSYTLYSLSGHNLTLNSNNAGTMNFQVNSVAIAYLSANTLYPQTDSSVALGVATTNRFNGLHVVLNNAATTSAMCYNTTTGTVSYDGTLGTCNVSALRYKNPIAGSTIKPGVLASLVAFRTEAWTYKQTKENKGQFDTRVHLGLYADDVEKMDKRCVGYKDGKLENYDRDCVLAYHTAAFKELKAANDNLTARLDNMTKTVDNLIKMFPKEKAVSGVAPPVTVPLKGAASGRN